MEAFVLAQWFVEYLNTEWTSDPDPGGPLTDYFDEWAQSRDLLGLTGGDQALALQTLLIAWAWFTQRPQDFGRCAPYIDGLANISLEERTLPDPINPLGWRVHLFERKYGSR